MLQLGEFQFRPPMGHNKLKLKLPKLKHEGIDRFGSLFGVGMLRVGLTGSIAVGKTFVTGVLAELGCHIIDADQTAREVVQPGTPGLQAVVETFGTGILQPDGTLDRQKLGSLVFENEEKRKLLNAILHPYIIARQDEELHRLEEQYPDGIAVVDAALMIESGGYRRFDKLIVVHCDPEVQLERIMTRSKLSRTEAQKRVEAQMPQEEKKKFADYLIDTSADFESTREQTKEVFRDLLRVTETSDMHPDD